MKKFLAAFTLLFAITACSNNSVDPLPTNSKSASSEEIEITTLDHLSVSTYALPEDKTYDHIDAVKLTLKDGASDVETTIANTVNEWIASEIGSFQKRAKENFKTKKKSDVLEFNMTYDESAVSNGFYGLTLSYYTYEGGAHGAAVIKTFGFNLSDGSTVSLISQIDPAQRIAFNEVVASALGEQAGTFGVDLDEKATILQTLENDVNFDAWFASKKDGLAIIFQQYAVGPYSSGQPAVSFSWEEVRQYFKSDSIITSEFAN